MPFRSKAQERWGHSPAGVKALGGQSAVQEWQSATPARLPERVAKPKGVLGKIIAGRKRG